MNARNRTLRVDYLARVEGEGALEVKIKDGRVADVKLRIFEPPRFFEAFLRGRDFREAPDLTARICGICPVAYQMSAVQAMEDALGVRVDGPLRDLRRLLYCGEWIESHALHVVLLHAPDFLGYPDAVAMAREHGDAVRRGLALKKAGNDLVATIGGREIHPINVRVGGFYRVPTRAEAATLAERFKPARDLALATLRWAATFPFPDLELDYEFVALRNSSEYPINEGRLATSRGEEFAVAEFAEQFVEEQVAHSNALSAVRKGGGPYLVGPLARYALNRERLSAEARAAAAEVGLGATCRNPFRSILVRGVELVYACAEALRILEGWRPPDAPCVEVPVRAGVGHGGTEAPRGLLYHRYRIDAAGAISEARIVPPTAQNQRRIEEDLRVLIGKNLELPTAELTLRCEQAIRNYDPCISCATHFLRLSLERAD